MKNPLGYSVSMQTSTTDESGFPAIPAKKINYLNLQHIAYVRDTTGREILYLNGEATAEGYRPTELNIWKNNFYLRLGNENDLKLIPGKVHSIHWRFTTRRFQKVRLTITIAWDPVIQSATME